MKNKRFTFSTIAIIFGSIVTVILKYDAESYLKLVGIIVAVYQASQTLTDHKKIMNGDDLSK